MLAAGHGAPGHAPIKRSWLGLLRRCLLFIAAGNLVWEIAQLPLSTAMCANQRYIEERLRRIAMTGIPPAEAERVKTLCAGMR